jgi:hypothetical protein
MASRAFDKWAPAPETDRQPLLQPLTLVAPMFTRSEYQVIELARRDSVWSIRPRSLLVRLFGRLFGIHPQTALAEPRLEAVRRFAVAARARGTMPDDGEYRLFEAAGFTATHADFIVRKMSEKLPLSRI